MKEPKTPQPETTEPAKSRDLSAEIARTIAREPGEQVTCRHIVGDRYRCNWWQRQNSTEFDNPSMPGLLVATSRIHKSQFLKVEVTPDGLKIENVSARG